MHCLIRGLNRIPLVRGCLPPLQITGDSPGQGDLLLKTIGMPPTTLSVSLQQPNLQQRRQHLPHQIHNQQATRESSRPGNHRSYRVTPDWREKIIRWSRADIVQLRRASESSRIVFPCMSLISDITNITD